MEQSSQTQSQRQTLQVLLFAFAPRVSFGYIIVTFFPGSLSWEGSTCTSEATILVVLGSASRERRTLVSCRRRRVDGAIFATESDAAKERMIEAMMSFMWGVLGFQSLYGSSRQCLFSFSVLVKFSILLCAKGEGFLVRPLLLYVSTVGRVTPLADPIRVETWWKEDTEEA